MAPFDGVPATPLQSSPLAKPRTAHPEAQDLTLALCEVIDGVVAAAVVAGQVRPIVEVALTGACRASLWPALLRVVDELVTNSVEHAFADHERGRIIVSIDGRRGPGVVVSVSDTGPGFRQDSTLEGNGMRLLGVLGDVSVTCADGCCTVSCDIPSRRKWPAIVNRTYPAVSQ